MKMLWLAAMMMLMFHSQMSFAEVCEDEINHLKEFEVYYIPRPAAPNPSFVYNPIAGSNMVVAIPKEISGNQKVETSSTADGYVFLARGMLVGISGEFDKIGKCLNAVTFDYDVMTNELPKSVKNMSLTFNYNFQVAKKSKVS